MAGTDTSGESRELEVVVFSDSLPARITKFKVRRNELVAKDQILLLHEVPQSSDASDSGVDAGDGKLRAKFIKAKFMGSVVEFLVKEGDVVHEGTPLLSIRKGCSHPVLIKDMCADCGSDLRKDGQLGVRNEKVTAAVPMVHSIPELIVSNEHAAKLGQDDVDRMLKSRRLALLVDLDQTLIHTTNEVVSNQVKDIHHFQLYGPKTPWYHTKLRPGTADFLAEVQKYFELHICTFGTRMYAHQIAKILDPDGSLFSHRILSRDELLDPFLKTANMKSLFPCGDQMVCIIDDREDVWNYAPNLVHVKPYHYFQNVGDINSPFPKVQRRPKPPWATEAAAVKAEVTAVHPDVAAPDANGTLETSSAAPPAAETAQHQYASRFGDDGQEESDDYLLYLKQILITVHDAFYQLHDEKLARTSTEDSAGGGGHEPDLKSIVPYVRKKVLAGCNIVFTGLFPHDVQSEEKSKALALAKSFGADVGDELVLKEDDNVNFTTHLIAAKDGTVKVTTARKTGYIDIVVPDWLTECIRRWEKVDERLYPLQESSKSCDAFFRDTAFHKRPAKPDEDVSSDRLPSTSSDKRLLSRSVSCLSGISADVLHTMEDEIDDAINSDGEDEEDDDQDEHSSSEENEKPETSPPTASRKRKQVDVTLDLEEESDVDEDDRDAKHFRSDDFRLSSSSSSSNEHAFSDDDDDNTLGELAADLDRQLSE